MKLNRVTLAMNQEAKAQEVPNAERLRAAETIRTLSVWALIRTAFSSERSLMAWMRTSVSLYSFGFTITKFVDYLERQGEGSQFSEGPRRLGISLIGVGILVLVLAVVEHVQRLRMMREQGLPPDSGSLLPIGSAGAIFAIGVVALVSVFLNWHL